MNHAGAGYAHARRRTTFASGLFLVGLSIAACSVAASPSPSSLPIATATATTSPAPEAPTTTATAPWIAPVAVASLEADPSLPDEADPTDSPTPPLPKGPLPSVGPVPAGTWTGLKWIALPGGHAPAVPPSNADVGTVNAKIAGWSKGYVEFIWNPSKRTLVPWGSLDGLTWHSGTTIDTSAWAPDFKVWDSGASGSDSTLPEVPGDCEFSIDQFEEGPASLVLTGHATCWTAGCGSYPFLTRSINWVSTDALNWTVVDLTSIFGTVGWGSVSGGSSGFIALGAAAKSDWTSQDGQQWNQGSLPPAVLTPGSTASVPVAIAGGFVLPSVILEKKGHSTPGSGVGGGCAGGGDYPTDLSLYQSVLWWSSDGTTWTRDTLRGTTSSYSAISMTVSRIDDRLVIAHEQIGDTVLEWASTDGRSWTGLKGDPVDPYDTGGVIAGRDHGLVTAVSQDADQPTQVFSVFDPKFNLVALKQTGSYPWIDDWQMALGPTGLLVTSDGSRFWIGEPSAG